MSQRVPGMCNASVRSFRFPPLGFPTYLDGHRCKAGDLLDDLQVEDIPIAEQPAAEGPLFRFPAIERVQNAGGLLHSSGIMDHWKRKADWSGGHHGQKEKKQ